MRKLLRILGSNLYVERFEYYMDEMESVVFTTSPEEAVDCTDVLDPDYGSDTIEKAVSWVKEDRDALLEIVEVL